MSTPDDLERRLTDWLDAQAPTREPKGLADAVLARTRPARRMPGWPGIERWLPLTVLTRPTHVVPLRAAWLLLILLLTMALAGGGVIVGSRLLAGPSTGLPATALIPQGDAAVLAFATLGSDGRPAGDIFTIRADGTDERQLTSGPAVDSDPVWSPDGTRIAFRRWLGGADSLVVMDAGGGGVMVLATQEQTSQDCLAYFWSTAWSPDGSSLIFPTRDRCSGGPDLSIVAADGSAPPVQLLAHPMDSAFATWSPQGDRIALLGSDSTGDAALYVVDATAADARSGGLEPRRISVGVGSNLGTLAFGDEALPPAWSPDGTEISITKVTTGFFIVEADGVYLVKPDGSGERLLAARAGNARWSPDGRRLAFHRTVDPSEYLNDRPCTVRTHLIDRDGSNEIELPDLGDGCPFAPLWSPDGTRLASVLASPREGAEHPNWNLGIVMVDGSRAPLILSDARGSWQPVAAELPAPPSFPTASITP